MKRILSGVSAALLLAAIVVPGAAQSIDDLTMYTEEYPPFNFEQNGELQGISIDLMDEMLSRVGAQLSSDDIQLVPWSQGYERAQRDPNTAIFATTRTSAREDQFAWVGPISPTRVVLTGRAADDIAVNSLEDVENYTVGTVRDDVAETHLLDAGVPRNVLDPVATPEPNVQKLAAGRIDLWAYEESVALWLLSSHGQDPGDYDTYYVLDEGELHFAFHPDTPEEVIEELQTALDDIYADGTYDEITDRYLD